MPERKGSRPSPSGSSGPPKGHSLPRRPAAGREDLIDDEELAGGAAPAEPAPAVSPEADLSAPEEVPDAPRDTTPVSLRAPAPEPEDPSENSAPAPSRRGPAVRLSRGEMISLGAILLLALIGGILFFRYLYADAGLMSGSQSAPELSLPVRGEIATLTQVEHHWRERQEGDPGSPDEVVRPEVVLTLDPQASGSGYLRVEFQDSRGRIRGDIVTVKVENGAFKPLERGERVAADGRSVAVVATEGFPSVTHFRAYLGNEEPRWQVRLEEGADYSRGPWKTLARFPLRNANKPKDTL